MNFISYKIIWKSWGLNFIVLQSSLPNQEVKILNWSSEITKNIKGVELLKNINFIKISNEGWRNNKDWDGKSSGFGSNKIHSLHSEGLLKDDMHLSESGNKKLAVGFYEALKDEKLFSS
jgi:hypothetical protein